MEITSQLTAEEKRAIIRDNGGDKEHLLAILYELQNASGYNYIDEETAALVAEEVGMNPTRVYDIITFYAMLKTEPKARYVLKVCNSTPCHFSRSEEIAQILKEELGVGIGETTEDGLPLYPLCGSLRHRACHQGKGHGIRESGPPENPSASG